MQLSFGSGAIWGERTDATGSGIGPRQFGVLQEIQIDFDWSDKELYGQRQFPIAIASYQIGIYFFYLLGNQAKLRDPLRIELFFVTKGDGVKREYGFTCRVYRFDSLLEPDSG